MDMADDFFIKPVDPFADSAKGGDFIFIQAGQGWSRNPDHKPEHGSVVFKAGDGAEALRIDPDGTFKVHGEPVAKRKDLFHAFSDWLFKNMRPLMVGPTTVAYLSTTAPSDTRVWVVEDDFKVTLTKTRSEPWQRGHGQWVVLLVGRTGGFAIERVFPAP